MNILPANKKKFLLAVKIILGVLLWPCVFWAQAGTAWGSQEITVVFRFDDYSNRYQNLDDKVIEAFYKHGLMCSVGVIPFQSADKNIMDLEGYTPLKPSKIQNLKQYLHDGVIEVVLHGYCHRPMLMDKAGGKSEFYGLDYQSQLARIKKGKEFLEENLGITIKTFIPPYNSYDSNTLLALEKLGFKYFSADKYHVAYKTSPFKFLPQTCDLDEVKGAVLAARKSKDKQTAIVALFHPFDFVEFGPTKFNSRKSKLHYQELEDLLNWLAMQKDVKVRTFEQAAQAIADLSPQRFLAYESYFKIYDFIPPWRFFDHAPLEVYLSSSYMNWAKWKFFGFLLLTGAVTAAIAFQIGLRFFRKARMAAVWIKWGGVLGLVLLALYALHSSGLTYRGVLGIVLWLSFCISFWGADLKSRL